MTDQFRDVARRRNARVSGARPWVLFGLMQFLVLVAIGLLGPTQGMLLFVEDGVVEMLGAVLFGVAALIAARQLWRGRVVPAWLGWAVGGLALIFALDEISFGQRLLGWTPVVVSGVPIDGLHDWLQVMRRGLRQVVPKGDVVLVVLLLGMAAAALWAWRRCRGAGGNDPDLPVPAAFVLLCLATGLIGLGQFLDLNIWFLRDPLVANSGIEESVELAAAVLMVGAARTLPNQ